MSEIIKYSFALICEIFMYKAATSDKLRYFFVAATALLIYAVIIFCEIIGVF